MTRVSGLMMSVCVAMALMLVATSASFATILIAHDRGGRIGTYIDKFEGVRNSGETVVIDGLCASACTIVLGAVPRDRICVTPRANLGFHAAWDPGPSGEPVPNASATRLLFSLYPTSVQRWIARHGGLKPRMIFLRGNELARMYKPCYMDASASARATR